MYSYDETINEKKLNYLFDFPIYTKVLSKDQDFTIFFFYFFFLLYHTSDNTMNLVNVFLNNSN